MSRIFLLQDRKTKSHLCCTGHVHQSPDSDQSPQKCFRAFKEQTHLIISCSEETDDRRSLQRWCFLLDLNVLCGRSLIVLLVNDLWPPSESMLWSMLHWMQIQPVLSFSVSLVQSLFTQQLQVTRMGATSFLYGVPEEISGLWWGWLLVNYRLWQDVLTTQPLWEEPTGLIPISYDSMRGFQCSKDQLLPAVSGL